MKSEESVIIHRRKWEYRIFLILIEKKIVFLAEIVFLKFQTDPSGNLRFGKRHSSLNIFARLYWYYWNSQRYVWLCETHHYSFTGFFKSIRTKENDAFSHPILRFEIWKLHQKAQEIRFLLNGVQILRCFSFTPCNNMV